MQNLILTPQRLDGENFEAYKERRKVENRIVRGYLRDGLVKWVAQSVRPVYLDKKKTAFVDWAKVHDKGSTFTYQEQHGISRSEYRLNKLKERRG